MSLKQRLGFTQEPLYVMDGNAFLFRGYFANSRMTRTDGFPTGALFIVGRVLLKLLREEKPDVVIIDSIQTMNYSEISSSPGSVSQVRESTNVFMQLAKGLGISIFIVGHVTKEGTVAGPRVLEHMVDTVLYFEGDRHASYRILRGVKNRFGSTNEIGVFEMRQNGLVEVENPSEFMLNGKPLLLRLTATILIP